MFALLSIKISKNNEKNLLFFKYFFKQKTIYSNLALGFSKLWPFSFKLLWIGSLWLDSIDPSCKTNILFFKCITHSSAVYSYFKQAQRFSKTFLDWSRKIKKDSLKQDGQSLNSRWKSFSSFSSSKAGLYSLDLNFKSQCVSP